MIVYAYIKLAGVKADSIKRIIQLLSGKDKFEPKILSDLSQFTRFNRIENLALLYNAYRSYVAENLKNNVHKERKLNTLGTVFKDISFTVKISSLNEKFQSIMCDPVINPFGANEMIEKRFENLNQKLQHQTDDSFTFENTSACIVHNVVNPCKDIKCGYPHICSLCGDRDHTALELRCAKPHTVKDWFVKRMTEVNRYYNTKSKRSRNFSNNRGSARNIPYNRYNKQCSQIMKPLYTPPNNK